jgi:hypothetical protein
MSIIDTILKRDEFLQSPPVLLDIGAAGEINRKWKEIAKYSICIAFDADDREMEFTRKEQSGYRQLYIFHRIATEKTDGDEQFHLTKSPQCSSRLLPIQESLDNWSFSGLFHVEHTVSLKAISLSSVLKELNLNKVDWFKTDSQGTDLRLFTCLGSDVTNRVIISEFEPGFIDAYEGEDKLWRLMAFMEKQPFWMSSLDVKGSQRLHTNISKKKLSKLDQRVSRILLRTSPGWGEVTFMNSFPADAAYLDKRDYLLGWIFSTIESQHGFALEIAVRGYERFHDDIFQKLERKSLRTIKSAYIKLPVFFARQIACRIASFW